MTRSPKMRQIIHYLLSAQLASTSELSALEVGIAWLGLAAHLALWVVTIFFEASIYADNFSSETLGVHLLRRVVLAGLVLSSVSAGVLVVLGVTQVLTASCCNSSINMNLGGAPPVLVSVIVGSMKSSLSCTALVLIGAMAKESVSNAELFSSSVSDQLVSLLVLKEVIISVLYQNAKHKTGGFSDMYESTKSGLIISAP